MSHAAVCWRFQVNGASNGSVQEQRWAETRLPRDNDTGKQNGDLHSDVCANDSMYSVSQNGVAEQRQKNIQAGR